VCQVQTVLPDEAALGAQPDHLDLVEVVKKEWISAMLAVLHLLAELALLPLCLWPSP
jgi:hypothetical protein